MPQERLHKLLAQAGVASRRACEDLIRDGRVTINGQRATVGAAVDPAVDVVRVDGEVIALAQPRLVYIMLNKPAGVVSTAQAQSQEKRPTVLDLVGVEERVYPVGRLDADSEGLVLLTNDGSLTQRLTHARYGHQKVYRVLVDGAPTPEQLEAWAEGVILDDGPTAPCQVSVARRLENSTWLEVIMGEGRKRQIRRTASAVGLRVQRLIRTRIGPLRLSGVEPGAWRYLTDDEVAALRRPAPARPARRPAGPKVERPRRFRPPALEEKASQEGRRPGGKQRPGGRARIGGAAQPGGKRQPGGKARRARSEQSDWENRPPSRQRPARPGGGEHSGGKEHPGGKEQGGRQDRTGRRPRPAGGQPGGKGRPGRRGGSGAGRKRGKDSR